MPKAVLKKGEAKIVVAYVLAAVALLIFLLLLTKFRYIFTDTSDSDSCQMSNEQSHYARINDLAFFPETKCPTLSVTVKKGQEADDVANALIDTGREYLGLDKEIYDTKKQTYCSIRRVLQFENKDAVINKDELLELLDSKTMISDGKSVSALTYIMGTTYSDDNMARTTFTLDADIKTEKPIAIVFVQTNDPDFWVNVGHALPAPLGTVILAGNIELGPFGGAGVNWKTGLMVVKYDAQSIENDLGCTFYPSKQQTT